MRPISLTLCAVFLSLVRAGAALDLSGNWIIDGDVQGNAVSLACAVKQDAAKIAGKCQVNGTENTEMEGTAGDKDFKFAFSVQGYTLTYSGTFDGDAMSGDIEVAGVTGKFSGKRSPD
jgi:hypothetical protein